MNFRRRRKMQKFAKKKDWFDSLHRPFGLEKYAGQTTEERQKLSSQHHVDFLTGSLVPNYGALSATTR